MTDASANRRPSRQGGARAGERPDLGTAPGPVLAGDSFATAGRKAMWLHVERLLAREAALRDPAATDSLKRYRVATRRLRAAIRVFRDAWSRRSTKPLRAGLAELAGAVGAVRDLDVRLEHLGAWAAERGAVTVAGVEPLREAWSRQRLAAAETLSQRIETRRHTRLLDSLVSFVSRQDDGPAAAADPGIQTRLAGDRTPSAVWAAYEQVRAYNAVIGRADDATLHRLRIAAKRFRYTLEFLADLLGPERTWLVERLVELQDHLGAHNDAILGAAATRAFLEEHGEGLAPTEREAIEAYLGARAAEAAALRASVLKPWRPIVGTTFARRLASAVAPRPTRRPEPAKSRRRPGGDAAGEGSA